MSKISRYLLTVFIVSIVFFSDYSFAAKRRFMTIGTGGITGVYYPSGGAICRLVNRGRKTHGIRCSVESTGGSIYNVNAIRNNELDIGFAQSDWVHHAVNGTSVFKRIGKFENLRTIFVLHSEAFTVVARKDANIKEFGDLEGKRVSIGNPGSGQRATMQALMEAKGWTKKTFKLAAALKASEQSQALCDNKIDAMVYSVGHPNGSIQEASSTCETTIVRADDSQIEALINSTPYYEHTIIPGGMYGSGDPVVSIVLDETSTATVKTKKPHHLKTGDKVAISGATQKEYNIKADVIVITPDTFTYTVSGSPASPATDVANITYQEDIPTLGMRATVITSSDVDEDIVYTMVKSVFDNFDNFKTLHPVFATLTPEDMVPDPTKVQIHRGALKYFKEKGLIK